MQKNREFYSLMSKKKIFKHLGVDPKYLNSILIAENCKDEIMHIITIHSYFKKWKLLTNFVNLVIQIEFGKLKKCLFLYLRYSILKLGENQIYLSTRSKRDLLRQGLSKYCNSISVNAKDICSSKTHSIILTRIFRRSFNLANKLCLSCKRKE